MIHVIVNPLSAAGRALRAWHRVVSRVVAVHPVEVHQTQGPGDGSRLAADLVRDGATTIVIVGGDGSLHDVVNGVLAGSPPTAAPRLVVWPSGSGNDFARALGMSGSPETLLAVLSGSETQLVDAWWTSWPGASRCFVNVASFGLPARAVELAAWPGGRVTADRYVIGALRALWRKADFHIRLSTDRGRSSPMHLAAGVLANGAWFGAGMPVAPGAIFDDGRLDLIVARTASRPALLRLLAGMVAGRHLRSSLVEWRRVAELELEWNGELAFEMDGEAVRVAPPLAIRCLPRALRFGVPSLSAPQ